VERILSLFTSGPASILPEKWGELGILKEKGMADLTVLELDSSQVVDTSQWQSRARNCPWENEILSGWPVMTFLKGVPFDRGEGSRE
jgi:dihydroorotase